MEPGKQQASVQVTGQKKKSGSPPHVWGLALSVVMLSLTAMLIPQALLAAGRPIVVDLTTLTANPRTEAISPFVTQGTPLKPGSYPLITASNPAFVSLYHWVYPSSAALECPFPLFKLDDELVAVNKLIQELELEKAIQLLEVAWSKLPCQVEPLNKASLQRLFYLEGIAWHYQGDTDSSQRAFLEAMAIEDSLSPLEGFAPEINDAYLQAARGLSLFKPISLPVDAGLRKTRVLLDGAPLPETGVIQLRPGRHVLQKAGPEGALRTATFTLADGEKIALHTLAGLEPPEPAAVLRELLRSALLGESLSTEQAMALSSYAGVKGHSYMVFVAVNARVPGTLKLLIFKPGKGLIEGVPADLANMDPLPAEVPAAGGGSGVSSTGAQKAPGGAGKPVVSRPVGLGGTAPAREHTSGLRVSVGTRTYKGSSFLTFNPDFRLLLGPFLEAEGTLIYGVRGGDTGPQQLYGLRLGAGARLKLGSLWLRAQPGVSMLAVDVVQEAGGGRLLLQIMPELEVGMAASLTEQLELSAYSGLGYGPGLVGNAAFAWTSGLGLVLGF